MQNYIDTHLLGTRYSRGSYIAAHRHYNKHLASKGLQHTNKAFKHTAYAVDSRYLLALPLDLLLGLLLSCDAAAGGGLALFLGGLADGRWAEEGGLDGGDCASHQLIRGRLGRSGDSRGRFWRVGSRRGRGHGPTVAAAQFGEGLLRSEGFIPSALSTSHQFPDHRISSFTIDQAVHLSSPGCSRSDSSGTHTCKLSYTTSAKLILI